MVSPPPPATLTSPAFLRHLCYDAISACHSEKSSIKGYNKKEPWSTLTKWHRIVLNDSYFSYKTKCSLPWPERCTDCYGAPNGPLIIPSGFLRWTECIKCMISISVFHSSRALRSWHYTADRGSKFHSNFHNEQAVDSSL